MNQNTVLWVLVVFFGGLRRLTEDESTGVVIAVQLGALVLVVALVMLVARRIR